jgi:glycosyltransferase involved in cell wall biosynthesis
LNILCIGPAHPLRGGIANFNASLCRSLNRTGHQASIISFSLQYPGFLFPGKTQYESTSKPEDIRIRALINSINPLSWFRTARLLIKENPDLVILHYWMPFTGISMGFIARQFRRKAKAPIIAIAHNIIPHEKQPLWKRLTSYLVGSCDGFIVLSRSVLDDLDLFTGNPHRAFVPHPVYEIFGDRTDREEAASKLELDPGASYILFFGVIREYKGLDLLVRAFAACAGNHPGLRLLVAGEFYSDRQEYTDLIAELNLGDRVIIRDGFIPADRVKYYFSLADLVAQPYRTATQSGVTQIAYNFEVPMLVTRVGGLPEMVPDGKVGYVTDVDVQSVADAISDFFDSDRAEFFRKNISREKKRFSWEAMVSAIEDMAGRISES